MASQSAARGWWALRSPLLLPSAGLRLAEQLGRREDEARIRHGLGLSLWASGNLEEAQHQVGQWAPTGTPPSLAERQRLTHPPTPPPRACFLSQLYRASALFETIRHEARLSIDYKLSLFDLQTSSYQALQRVLVTLGKRRADFAGEEKAGGWMAQLRHVLGAAMGRHLGSLAGITIDLTGVGGRGKISWCLRSSRSVALPPLSWATAEMSLGGGGLLQAITMRRWRWPKEVGRGPLLTCWWSVRLGSRSLTLTPL